jgi:hypothetical protein
MVTWVLSGPLFCCTRLSSNSSGVTVLTIATITVIVFLRWQRFLMLYYCPSSMWFQRPGYLLYEDGEACRNMQITLVLLIPSHAPIHTPLPPIGPM